MNRPWTILEINTRVWLRELGGGIPISLADVDLKYLAQWKSRGIDAVWLMGVWMPSRQSAVIARMHEGLQKDYAEALPDWNPRDVAASPYALVGYRVNFELGGEGALAEFRRRLHEHGLKLILDFVPGHTACDHPWTHDHPSYYVRGAMEDVQRDPASWFLADSEDGPAVIAHGRDPYFPAWSDTAQLDVRSPDVQEVLIGELLSVAERCDGVRCDMAMLILSHVFTRTWGGEMREFWPHAIRRLREKFPDFLLIAEVYWGLDLELNEMGFDLTYDKDPRDWVVGPSGLSRVQFDYDESKHRRRLRFLENHDEPRIAAQLPLHMHRAAALWLFTLPSSRLLWQGQFLGHKARLPVQLLRAPDEEVDPAVVAMYEDLEPIFAHPAIKSGSWQLLRPRQSWQGNESYWQILGQAWDGEHDHLRVFVNWADHRSQCWVDLGFGNLQGREVYLRDQFSDKVFIRDGVELMMRGLYLDMEPWETHAFNCEIRDAAPVTEEQSDRDATLGLPNFQRFPSSG